MAKQTPAFEDVHYEGLLCDDLRPVPGFVSAEVKTPKAGVARY